MASECKLCGLLGARLNDSSNRNQETHVRLHARQVQLIDLNQTEWTIIKSRTVPNGSDAGAKCEQSPKEKSEKFVLFRFCRELVKAHEKGCDFTCSQCKHSIKLQRSTKKTSNSLISHCCIHLNKDLFACRHCHLKFISKCGIYHHLHRIHSMGSNCANYIDMMEDHQSEIMDMINHCFGQAPRKQLNVTAFGKQKKNIKDLLPLVKLANVYLGNYELGNRIQCQLCPTSIPNNRNRQNAARRLVDHCRWHLDKPLFSCRLCPYFASTQGRVNQHLMRHSVALSKQNFKDGSSEYFEEISAMMEDCFGKLKKEKSPVIICKEEKRTRQAQSKIRGRCGTNLLLAERQLRCTELAERFQRSGKLQCRLCRVHLVVESRKGAKEYVSSRDPTHHVLSHFNKILFTCRRCSHTSTSRQMIGKHVRSKHGVPVRNEFHDRTDDFHADFMEMLSKCFDWEEEPERPEEFITTQKNPLSVKCRMRDKGLKTARHVHACKLIRNHATDGKIICRICSHPTSASGNVGSNMVFRHSMTHLDRRFWPYRCSLCSYVANRKECIRNHLKKIHKVTDARKFEDMSDKVHKEIVDVLSECYDWNKGPGEIS